MKNKERLKTLLAAIIVCFTLFACADHSQTAVYKELLVEARWIHNVDFPVAGEPDSYLFNFLDMGVVKIYPIFGGEVNQDGEYELRYIYDPDLGEMAVEDHGIFGVKKIDTDEMVLESAPVGQYKLVRYKDHDPVEAKGNK